MSAPRHHVFLTKASNYLRDAAEHIEQSWFDNHDPEYKKLHDAAVKLHARFFRKWERQARQGKKAGWFS